MTTNGKSARMLGLTVSLAVVLVACGTASNPLTSSRPSLSPASDLPSSALLDGIKSNGAIRFGVAVGIPWLGKDPASGEYFGSARYMADKIAERLGVEAIFVEETYANMIPALQADKIDLAIAPLYATPERLEVVSMTPYAVGGFCYLLKKDNQKIQTLSDLNSEDVTMANGEGTGGLAVVSAKYPKAKQLTRFAEVGETVFIPEVLSGRADVAPSDNTTAAAFAEKYDLRVIPEDCYNDPDIPTPVAVAYNKGDPGFEEFISAFIPSIRSGIDAESAKYLGTEFIFPGDSP